MTTTNNPKNTPDASAEPITSEGLTREQWVARQRTANAMTDTQRAIAQAMADDPDADYMTILVRLNID